MGLINKIWIDMHKHIQFKLWNYSRRNKSLPVIIFEIETLSPVFTVSSSDEEGDQVFADDLAA